MSRISWDEYFMEIAECVSTRATCDRLHVGAVIVKDKNILSTGYNGSISGLEHCDDVGHYLENDHCLRTVHAEANAICQAAKRGVSLDGSTIYVTHSPCFNCFKLCASAGIKKIVFDKFYRDENVIEFAKKANIELIDIGKKESPQEQTELQNYSLLLTTI